MSGLELHEAASTGDFDSLEEYLSSGKYDVNLKDAEWKNKTALHWAAAKGFVECIRVLLDHGAKGTARQDMGWTPAHCAAEAGRLPALRALHAANVPVYLKDKYGDKPRRIAEIYGHTDCVKFLEQAEEEMFERKRRMSAGVKQDEWSDDDKDDADDIVDDVDLGEVDDVVREMTSERDTSAKRRTKMTQRLGHQ